MNKLIAAAVLGFLWAIPPARAADAADKMNWWRDARYGLFIHWGLYAVPAGTWTGRDADTRYSGGLGEWLMHDAKIPVADYAALAGKFNPTKFDADAWADMAQAAGMKYVVITAKHHDGFAMFHSKVDDFNIVDGTPFKRDVVDELSKAVRKRGMKFGVYYSQCQDWHHPGGAAIGGHWDKAQDGDYDQYLQHVAAPQVKELLTNYGDISVIWWDTDVQMNKERATPLHDLLSLQLGIIDNDRLGYFKGDTTTPEQHIPANGFKDRDWETCMTINDTWGYKSKDNHFKSTRTLLHNLVDIASKGGNYLLNVGPDETGVVPQPEVDRLKEIGEWLKKYGAAVYGTTATPFKQHMEWGRVTQRPGQLYLTIFDVPTDGVIRLPMSNHLKSIQSIDEIPLGRMPTRIESESGPDGVTIHVPKAISKQDMVLVVDIDGPVETIDATLKQSADGSITLKPDDADLKGSVQVEDKAGKPSIGYWTDAKSAVSWAVEIDHRGTFTVELSYAVDDGTAGSTFTISAGDSSAAGTVEKTGGWDSFKAHSIGELTIDKAGKTAITVKATSKPGYAVMNLRAVKLTLKSQ